MKKKLFVISAVLVTFVLAIGLTVVSSATDEIQSGVWGDLNWSLNLTTGELNIYGTGEMEDLDSTSSFSESWEAYRCDIKSVNIESGVTSIGKKAFVGFTELTNVMIAEGVTKIEDDAFSGSTGLTSINLPNSLTSIGQGAFRDCTELKSIIIPEGVTNIEYRVFYGCTGLTDITIPKSVTSIEEGAFSDCMALTGIEIPKGVTSIGDRAFSDCAALKEVKIPEGVTSIGAWAFSNCAALKEVKIPEGVTSIGFGAFSNCAALKDVEIPESVTQIGYSIFEGCNELIQVENGVLYVDKWAIGIEPSIRSVTLRDNTVGISGFSSMRLENITLPDSVKFIGGGAFYGCRNLTDITIPAGVISIGSEVFEDCTALTSITVDSENPNYYSQNGVLYNNPVTELIHVPARVSGHISIVEGTQSIGYRAFEKRVSVTGITIPSSVTSLDSFAFASCCGLTNVTLPDSVTSIGPWAFPGCDSLTSITIPESVTSIGLGAFSGCDSLTSITIPESVTSIGPQAFAYCSNLTAVYLSCKTDWNTLGDLNLGVASDKIIVLHTWGNGTITVVPTHLTAGVKSFVCKDCGTAYDEAVDKLAEHTYGEWIKKDSTQHQKECVCGDIQIEEHIYDHDQDLDCNICGATSESMTVPSATESITGDSNKNQSGCGASLTGATGIFLLFIFGIGETFLRKRKS